MSSTNSLTFNLVVYGLFSLLGCVATACASAAEFTDAERQEIGAIVREYLLKNPEVLVEVSAELQKREAEAQAKATSEIIRQNADEIFRSKNDHVVGNPEGTVTVVEFSDYNCPYCKRSYPIVMKLLETDPDVRLVMKEFPILGEGSEFASRAAVAAMQQGKYWPLHQAMMAADGRLDKDRVLKIAGEVGLDLNKLAADMQAASVAATIEGTGNLAMKLGINGTPAFIIGDQLFPGGMEMSELAARVAEARAAGCAVC